MNSITPFRPQDLAGRWSEAVAEICFPVAIVPRPVYLSPTDEQIVSIAQKIDPSISTPEKATDALSGALKETLNLDFNAKDRSRTFSKYRTLSKFYDQLVGPEYSAPPCLALLALLGRAARLMGSTSGYSPNNFYGPLSQMLGIPSEKADLLGQDYRHDANQIWSPLPHWLASHNGIRGVSTLQAFGKNVYIAVPLSQAIFVENDAHRIADFFDRHEFSATSVPGLDELKVALDEWVADGNSTCPQRVRELWPDRNARETITEMLRSRMEFHKKNSKTVTESGQRVVLRYTPSQPPFRSAALGFSIRLADEETSADSISVSFGTRLHQGNLLRDVDGSYRLEQALAITDGIRDLIGATFKIFRSADQKVLAVHRNRNGIYVLVRDVPRSVFVESTNPPRGAECILFVDAELAPKVSNLLHDSSQGGWTQVPLPGAAGWVIFEKVFIRKRSHLAFGPLSCLQPRSRKGVQLAGGLELPLDGDYGAGSWLADLPPTVSVLSEEGHNLECQISQISSNGLSAQCFREKHGPELLLDLRDLQLAPGKYSVAVAPEGGAPYPIVVLSLCSPQPERKTGVSEYSPSPNPLWPISSNSEKVSGDKVLLEADALNPGSPIWVSRERQVSNTEVVVHSRPLHSAEPEYSRGDVLMYEESVGRYIGIEERGGVARMQIEFPPVSKRSRDSGVVRLLPMAMWDAVVQVSADTPLKWSPPSVAKRVAQILLEQEPSTWEAVLDVGSLKSVSPLSPTLYSEICAAIACIQSGPAEFLNEVSQIAYPEEPTALARYRLLQQLESEGKITVSRDELGYIEQWHLSPPRLVGLGGGSFALAGILTPTELEELGTLLPSIGLQSAHSSSAVRRWQQEQPGAELPAAVKLKADLRVTIDPGWSSTLLRSIIPISQVVPSDNAIHKFSSLDIVEQWYGPWDNTATWQTLEQDMVAERSVVRIQHGNRKIDGISLGRQQILCMNSNHAKLVVGALRQWNLTQYSNDYGGVVLPAGIHPPGIYGRALRLLSSSEPQPITTQRNGKNLSLVKYPGVPKAAAEIICAALNG